MEPPEPPNFGVESSTEFEDACSYSCFEFPLRQVTMQKNGRG